MKHLLIFSLSLFLMGLLFVSCIQEMGPTAVGSESPSSLAKVTFNVYSYELELDGFEIEGCATGETMTQYGTIMVYITERTTPSGNTTLSGYSDYSYSPITLEGQTSGTWTLTNGNNHFGEVYKEFNYWPDYFVQHYQWKEFYENANGEKLRYFVQGIVKVYPDGTIELERYKEKCF